MALLVEEIYHYMSDLQIRISRRVSFKIQLNVINAIQKIPTRASVIPMTTGVRM